MVFEPLCPPRLPRLIDIPLDMGRRGRLLREVFPNDPQKSGQTQLTPIYW